MATLNLYKEREPHKIVLENDGKKKEFKLPTRYTVEETERLLEAQIKITKEADKEVDVSEDDTEEYINKTKSYWDAVFNQLIILFNHYHPELTKEELKRLLTRDEAIQIILFYREQQAKEVKEAAEEGKKKAQKKS